MERLEGGGLSPGSIPLRQVTCVCSSSASDALAMKCGGHPASCPPGDEMTHRDAGCGTSFQEQLDPAPTPGILVSKRGHQECDRPAAPAGTRPWE